MATHFVWGMELPPFGSNHGLHMWTSTTETSIKDIILNGKWNLNVLYTNLPQNITNHIMSISPHLNPSIQECFTCHAHLSGTYTANVGYKWLISRYHHNNYATIMDS